MQKLVSAFWTAMILCSILGLFTLGCVSGPVTTQIDKNKNPVVTRPLQFQSPIQAIDGLLSANDSKVSNNHQVQLVRSRSLRIEEELSPNRSSLTSRFALVVVKIV